jgi:hypothetical protein
MSSYDRPSFGIILSLLAIGLVVNALRGFADLFMLFMQDGTPAEGIGSLIMDIVAFIWALACLVMLLARRRVFIYLFGGLLLFNLATSAYLLMFNAGQLEPELAVAAMAAQLIIAALWLTYLFMSQHLRDVCCD